MISPKKINNLPLQIRREFEFVIKSVQSISGLSVIIPIRGLDRQNNLNFCISRLLLQNVEPVEIIVSEEDVIEKINISKFSNDSRVRKIFTKGVPYKFNKSISINAGFAVSSYKKIVMNDVDIIPPKGYFSRIDLSLNDYDLCFFGKEIYNVSLMKTNLIWDGSKRTDYFSGGSIAFTKEGFAKIGGMCEKFYGYGSEDCEFWGRANKLLNIYEKRDLVFLHLNHKRENSYSVNGDIYNQIMDTSIEDRLISLKQDFQKRTGWGYNV